jgi:hypothetical protein
MLVLSLLYIVFFFLFFSLCFFFTPCYLLSPISPFRLNLLPYSLSFLLSFIWILSHLLKQAPQSNVAMVTKKQLTGGGNEILLSVTVSCEPTLCLSENNITVYFKQQEMIHCNGKQI